MSRTQHPTITAPVRIVDKPWGREIWFANNDLYCGKILEIEQGQKCSLHFHLEKDETLYVLSGRLLFRWVSTDDGQTHSHTIRDGECIRLVPGQPHQFEALDHRAVICEASTHHEDADSFRIAPVDQPRSENHPPPIEIQEPVNVEI